MGTNDNPKKTNAFSSFLKFTLRILELSFLLFCWLIYAFTTQNRSEQALAYTGGNPLPGKFSILALSLVFLFFFRKTLFVKKWSAGLVILRLIVVAVLVFGILIYKTNVGL